MQQTTYEAIAEFWHRGVLVQPGRQLALSEREARYHLLNGELKPVQTAIEQAEKAAAEPKKRGK
jgi:hypothetical protein